LILIQPSNKNNLLSLGILFFLLINGLSATNLSYGSMNIDNSFDINQKQSIFNGIDTQAYNIHSPIKIDGDLDFHNQAALSGWDVDGRDGSPQRPYLISNYNITNSTGILFSMINTGVSFILANNYLNLLTSNGKVIDVVGISNSIIFNNTIIGGFHGIWFKNSQNSIIKSNHISNTLRGIDVIGGSNNKIINNKIIENRDGIVVEGFTNSLRIEVNDITNNTNKGIIHWDAFNTKIESNNISYNFIGILFQRSGNLQIQANTINSNRNFGLAIFTEGSNAAGNNGIIRWNNFIDNKEPTNQTADEGTGNLFEYNYYNDHTGIIGSNNIYTNPYVIKNRNNITANTDNYPLGSPYILNNFNIMASMVSSYRPIEISWNQLESSYTHQSLYTIEYSINNSINLHLIVNDYNGTNYSWDAFDVNVYDDIQIHITARTINGLISTNKTDTFNVYTTILPSAPTNLQLHNYTDYVSIQWSTPAVIPSNPISHYNIYRDVNGNGTILIANTTSMNYNDTDIQYGGYNYTYFISACTMYGESEFAVASIYYSSIVLPYAPRLLNAANQNNESVFLSWIEPTSSGTDAIIGYKIYRGVNGSTLNYYESSTQLNFTDLNIQPGNTYQYSIRAYSSFGDGVMSEIVEILIPYPSQSPPPSSNNGNNSPSSSEENGNWFSALPFNSNFIIIALGIMVVIQRKKKMNNDF